MQPTTKKMSKPLKEGQWCKPKDEREWSAVLDLSEALGVYCPFSRAKFEYCPNIWACGDEIVSECSSGQGSELHVSVPDFISGMYAMVEEKQKSDRAGDSGLGPVLQEQLREAQQAIIDFPANSVLARYFADKTNDRLRALEVKSVLFDDILKRLTTLETNPIGNHATQLSSGTWAIEAELSKIIRAAADSDRMIERLTALEEWRNKVI